MGINPTMLGPGGSPTSTSVADITQLVSLTLEPRICWADQLLTPGRTPTWKRLIDRPLSTDERISLITDIFSNCDEIEGVMRLCGDDAQLFVDVVDQVPPNSHLRRLNSTDLNLGLSYLVK